MTPNRCPVPWWIYQSARETPPLDQPYLTFTQRQLFIHGFIRCKVYVIVMSRLARRKQTLRDARMWGKSFSGKMDQEKMIWHRKKGLSWKHKRGVVVGSLHSCWDYLLEVFIEEQGVRVCVVRCHSVLLFLSVSLSLFFFLKVLVWLLNQLVFFVLPGCSDLPLSPSTFMDWGLCFFYFVSEWAQVLRFNTCSVLKHLPRTLIYIFRDSQVFWVKTH